MKSNNQEMERFMRSARGLPNAMPVAEVEGKDARPLARELFEQFYADLKEHEKCREPDRKLVAGETLTMDDIVEANLATPPDRVSFALLQSLAYHRPESVLAKWEEVRAAAREELASGWHAARSIQGDAWERACYLAIRELYHEMWPPRNGVESMLLDEMAQYETLRRKLLREVSANGWNDSVKGGQKFMGSPAILQAIDRLQRLYQYALRALLDMRRVPSPKIVQRVERSFDAPRRTQESTLCVDASEDDRGASDQEGIPPQRRGAAEEAFDAERQTMEALAD